MAASGAAGRARILGHSAVIFVSVGTELPFDRLIQAMDAWAAEHPDEEVLAQIGRGRYEPRHMRWSRRLGWDDYDAEVAASRLLVAHAGTGSVLTAGEWAKPIVVLPRRGQYGEHRNDHQMEWRLGCGVDQAYSWLKPRWNCPSGSPKLRRLRGICNRSAHSFPETVGEVASLRPRGKRRAAELEPRADQESSEGPQTFSALQRDSNLAPAAQIFR